MHVVTAELDVGKAKHLFSLRLGLSDIGPSSVGMVIMVVESEQGGVGLRPEVQGGEIETNNKQYRDQYILCPLCFDLHHTPFSRWMNR